MTKAELPCVVSCLITGRIACGVSQTFDWTRHGQHEFLAVWHDGLPGTVTRTSAASSRGLREGRATIDV